MVFINKADNGKLSHAPGSSLKMMMMTMDGDKNGTNKWYSHLVLTNGIKKCGYGEKDGTY